LAIAKAAKNGSGHALSRQRLTTAMIFAAATAPNVTAYRWTMKFPHGINSHLAGFVSKCEAAPIYEELLGAASD